jgi:hypothetical protein
LLPLEGASAKSLWNHLERFFFRILFKEALNYSSMNSQSEKSEKRGFRFPPKIKDSKSLILAAHPCAAGSSE